MDNKWDNNKAWFMVLPVFCLVAISAAIRRPVRTGDGFDFLSHLFERNLKLLLVLSHQRKRVRRPHAQLHDHNCTQRDAQIENHGVEHQSSEPEQAI